VCVVRVADGPLSSTCFMDSVIPTQEQSVGIYIDAERGTVHSDRNAACPTRVGKAVLQGDVDAVMDWVGTGGHPNALVFSGDTLVHLAAEGNQLAVVSKLIAAGADVNLANREGGNAFHSAAAQGHAEIVDVLIASKADINRSVGPPENATALLMATVGGHLSIVQTLLHASADLDHQDGQGSTALIQAAACANQVSFKLSKQILRSLLDAGCRTDLVDKFGLTALDVVTKEAPNASVARILIDHMVGAGCTVHSLVSRPELNGAAGDVVEWVAAKCRFAVKLRSGEVLAVRPANLSRVR